MQIGNEAKREEVFVPGQQLVRGRAGTRHRSYPISHSVFTKVRLYFLPPFLFPGLPGPRQGPVRILTWMKVKVHWSNCSQGPPTTWLIGRMAVTDRLLMPDTNIFTLRPHFNLSVRSQDSQCLGTSCRRAGVKMEGQNERLSQRVGQSN